MRGFLENLPKSNYKLATLPRSWNFSFPFSTLPKISEPFSFSEQDHSSARQWLANFKIDTIPRNICEINFSRSSGPGGQNVNKVNSKATVRFSMKDLLPLVPSIIHQKLLASQYYAGKSHTLVIKSDESRKASDNTQKCFEKLRDIIINAGKSAIKGETSPEQTARVKKLQKADNEARLRAKKSHSSKKNARKNFGPPT